MTTTTRPGPTRTAPTDRPRLVDHRPGVRLQLASLWTAMLFVFAYVDIFGFWRRDIIEGVLGGEVPGVGVTIDQTFLLCATVFVLLPTLLIPASLLLAARWSRVANLVVAPVYAVLIAALVIGETWLYYLVGSAVEVVLLATIAVLAWRWPRG